MGPFAGKVVLVTGASSGLGAAAARQFARGGGKVVVAARRRDKGEAVAQELGALGGEGLFVQADITKRADLEALIAATLERFGRLDAAVNNAGVSGPIRTPIAEIEEEGWDEVMNTNLKAVWMCMKHEIPAMLKSDGGGAIVNIASIYGTKPSDIGHAPYCASKFGVIGLSKSAAIDYAMQGVRVNVVSPGYAHSEMVHFSEKSEFWRNIVKRHTAMGRLGEADEIAAAVAWLCSDEARYVNGANLIVDGGENSKLA
ncbi:MAG: SDR family NAD(P)-dependent oxidoreductase [Hyphomonadaceae bacterium]